jgi:hypothetical protein
MVFIINWCMKVWLKINRLEIYYHNNGAIHTWALIGISVVAGW